MRKGTEQSSFGPHRPHHNFRRWRVLELPGCPARRHVRCPDREARAV